MSSRDKTLQRWLVLLFILLLVVALMPVGYLSASIFKELLDSGHIVLGAVCAVLLFVSTSYRVSKKYYALQIWFVTAIGLFFLELIQIPLRRNASFMDLVLGMCGAGAALLFIVSCRQQDIIWRRAYRLAGAILLLLALAPLMYTTTNYIVRHSKFPLLADFSSAFVAGVVKLHGAELMRLQDLVVGDDTFPAMLCLNPGKWSGVHLGEVVPDWSEYGSLLVVLYSELSAPVDLELGVRDRRHNHKFNDRYNLNFSLHAGINRIEIALDDIKRAPATREMDLHEVGDVMLFSTAVKNKTCFRLGTIRLLP